MAKRIVEISNEDNSKIYIEAEIHEHSQLIADKNGVIQAATKLEESLEPIVNLSKSVFKKITDVSVRKPSEIELTFAVKLSGKLNVWVISADGEGSIELKLKWQLNDTSA